MSIAAYRLKYIMLLKLPIILSRNSFNFYLLFPKLFYYSTINLSYVLQEPQYLTYKTQNIPFIILISHLMYNKSFLPYVLS